MRSMAVGVLVKVYLEFPILTLCPRESVALPNRSN